MLEFEISARSDKALAPVISGLCLYGIRQVLITHKSPRQQVAQIAKRLCSELPYLDVQLTLAMRHFTSERHFLDQVEKSLKLGLRRFLVVSGYPRPACDTLAALEILHRQNWPLQLSVTYTPTYDKAEQAEEDARLKAKCAFPLVERLYFQIADNIPRLEQAVSYVRALRSQLALHGCLLIPNPKVLRTLQFRPWHGVHLSTEFLSSIDIATRRTEQLLEFYQTHHVAPLIEMIPFP